MGADNSDAEHWYGHTPRHRVRISEPYYFGTTEVTQGQWESVMSTRPWSTQTPAQEGQGSDYPAHNIDWEDANEFCRKLSAKEGKTYRLPTEAEWEFACRAGTTTKWSFGEDHGRLNDFAWWGAFEAENTRAERFPHRVAMKQANPWGLFDIHGNVSEWCDDWYAATYYAESATRDPSGPITGTQRVCRGGGWSSSAKVCASWFRVKNDPKKRYDGQGFRLVLVP